MTEVRGPIARSERLKKSMKTYLRMAAAIALSITVPVPGSSARQITQAATECYSEYCEDDSLDVAGIPVDEIRELAHPSDEQRAALDELGNASVVAAQIVKAACPTDVSPTAIGRIEAVQQRVQAMLKAVNVEQPALAKFYNMLTDEQKARLHTLTQKPLTPANEGDAVATRRPPWPGAETARFPIGRPLGSCAMCIRRRCSASYSTHYRMPPRRQGARWKRPVRPQCRSPHPPAFRRSSGDCKPYWRLLGPCAVR
jgi:hypothetical protein